MAYSDVFEAVAAITFDLEGGDALSMDPHDRGNWTGGHVGAGELRGTRWGISAARYPNEDIANLTRDHAATLAHDDFWMPVRGDEMPGVLALLVFDCGFNSGPERGVRVLQHALGVHEDGVFGDEETMPAVRQAAAHDLRSLCVAYQVARLFFLVGTPEWPRDGHGFATRLIGLTYDSPQFPQHSASAE